jgi:hypothetical protein
MYLQLFFVRDYYSKESTWMLDFSVRDHFMSHSLTQLKNSKWKVKNAVHVLKKEVILFAIWAKHRYEGWDAEHLGKCKIKVQWDVSTQKQSRYDNTVNLFTKTVSPIQMTQAMTHKRVPRTYPILHSRNATCCLRSPLPTKKQHAWFQDFLLFLLLPACVTHYIHLPPTSLIPRVFFIQPFWLN